MEIAEKVIGLVSAIISLIAAIIAYKTIKQKRD